MRLITVVTTACMMLITSACIGSESTPCGPIVCPPGFSCETVAGQQQCLQAWQEVACAGASDGTLCDDVERGALGYHCVEGFCVPGICGDGVQDTTEECDSGSANADDIPDVCRPNCRLPRCGDGVVDPSNGEACDDGSENSDESPGACRTNCAAPGCGDGVVDGLLEEECDDGNQLPGDGCSADCRSIETCGNGIVDVAAGETCDTAGESATCNDDCTASICGDGRVNPSAGEVCDDGVESATCDVDCTPASCGDGRVNLAASEQCDDGNSDPGDGCQPDCQIARCGDGYLDPGEGCDDGPLNDDFVTDACRVSCTPAGCGDGTLDTGEACDDGNIIHGDGCSADCRTPCGDGIVDAPAELCDDDNLDGQSCVTLGLDRGPLACTEVCGPKFDGCRWNGWQPSKWSSSSLAWSLQDIAGTRSGDIWAVGAAGMIGHWDGATWSQSQPQGTPNLLDVHAISEDEVYAVGDAGGTGNNGVILRYDGTGWTTEVAAGTYPALRGIFGFGGNVIAVGFNGTVLRRQGGSWMQIASGVTNELWGVWASSPTDWYIAGRQTVVLHWDGVSGSLTPISMPTATLHHLQGVWGSGPNDVYIAGWGAIFHWNGLLWSQVWSGSLNLKDIHGTGPDNIFVAVGDGNLLHFDGLMWQLMDTRKSDAIATVWAASSADVVLGGNARISQRYEGNYLLDIPAGTSESLHGVWAADPGRVFAVGVGGTLLDLSKDGTVSTSHPSNAVFWDVWGSGSADVYAVGSNSTITRYDGVSWGAAMTVPALGYNVRAIHGSGANDIWAVGDDGSSCIAWRHQAGSWVEVSPMPASCAATPSGGGLTDVWVRSPSDVYAVDEAWDRVRLYHFNGSSWSLHTEELGWRGSHIWGTGPSDLILVGPAGSIRHYDGTSWAEMPKQGGHDAWFAGVVGTASNDVLAVASGGTLLHWDGTVWSPVRTGTSIAYRSISMLQDRFYLSGVFGTLQTLRRGAPWSCPDADLGDAVGDGLRTESNAGRHNNWPAMSGCTAGLTNTGEDVSLRWTAPAAGCFRIDTSASTYDTVLRVYDGGCNGSLLACDDDTVGLTSQADVQLVADQELVIVIDGFHSGSIGAYTLDINLVGATCP